MTDEVAPLTCKLSGLCTEADPEGTVSARSGGSVHQIPTVFSIAPTGPRRGEVVAGLGERGREAIALPQRRREDLLELEEGPRIVARALGESSAARSPRESDARSSAGTVARYRAHAARASAAHATGPPRSSCASTVGMRKLGNLAVPSMQSRAIWSRTPVFSNRCSTVFAYSGAGYPGSARAPESPPLRGGARGSAARPGCSSPRRRRRRPAAPSGRRGTSGSRSACRSL